MSKGEGYQEAPTHRDVQWLDKSWVQWCREHADELPCPIKSIRKTQGGIVLTFSGVHPKLKFLANDDSVSAIVNESQRLFGFGAFPVRNTDGRLRDICDDLDSHLLFDTEYDLWECKVFRPWLEETRKLLFPGMWVVLGEDEYGVKRWCEAVPQMEAYKKLAFHRGMSGGFRVLPEMQCLLVPHVMNAFT